MCIHGPISHCVQGYTQIRQRWCHWDINMPKRKWQYRFVRYVHCTDTVHKSGTAANKNKTEPYGFHTQHMAIHQMEEKRRKRMKSVKWNEFQWTDIHSITHFQCPLESLKLEEHKEFNQIQAMEYLAYICCILNISIKKMPHYYSFSVSHSFSSSNTNYSNRFNDVPESVYEYTSSNSYLLSLLV